MADHERRLVSKLAHAGAVEAAISSGIEPEHFIDESCRDIYGWCVDHARKYSTPPSFTTIRERFSDFKFEVISDSFDFIADQFRTAVKRRSAIDALRDLADAIDDPERVPDIDAHFLESSRRLSQLVPVDRTMRFSEMPSRIELWKQHQKSGKTPGIPLGIPTFDNSILGVQPHEYVSVVGWQGTGKSTLLQYIFFNAYAQGHTPMLVSLEMEAEALYRKWDVMCSNLVSDVGKMVAYHDMKALKMSDDQLKRWEAAADRVQKNKNDIIVIDNVGRCTVDRVYADTVRYKPNLVGVDYVSLMEAPSGQTQMWERVTYLTRNLKQVARSLKVPLFGVAQTNIDSADGGAKLENIAYSRSIGQDSDLVFGLFQEGDMRDNGQMGVRMLKNRDGAICETKMMWDMGHMVFREWATGDMFRKKGENGNNGAG